MVPYHFIVLPLKHGATFPKEEPFSSAGRVFLVLIRIFTMKPIPKINSSYSEHSVSPDEKRTVLLGS